MSDEPTQTCVQTVPDSVPGAAFILDHDGSLSAALARALDRAGFEFVAPGPDLTFVVPVGDAAPSKCLGPLAELRAAVPAAEWHGLVALLSPAAAAGEDGGRPPAAGREAVERLRAELLPVARRVAADARYLTLTARERQVAELVVRGLMNKEIAASLGVAERTVKVHRARAMAKLGVRSMPDFVRCVDRAVAAGHAPPGQTDRSRSPE